MTRHKFISKLFHIFMIATVVMQSLVYPWISLLPAPPGAKAQESPPVEATHSAETPAPSPLDPLLNPDTIFTSTNSAETITPEVIPEATPSSPPEPTPEATITPTPSPSTSVAPSPTPTPSPTVSSSPSPTPTTAPVATPTELLTSRITDSLISPFSISLQYPFSGSYPTSYGFGQRSPNSYISLMQSLFGVDAHDGLDFAMPIGTEILSTSAGTIISAGSGLYGTTIQIEHSWGISYYGHLSDTSVQAGDKVKAGQIIGYSGNSGVTTGPHLHFGIRPVSPNLLNGYHGMIDPAPYLQGIILPKILGTKDGKAIQNRARVRQIKNKFALAQNSLKNDDTNIKVNFASGESSDLNIVLKNPKGFEIDITDQTLGTLTGPLGPSLDVNLTEVVDLVPGLYQLTITDALGNYETQDFSWGVLAINTNKTIYLPSTPVDFSMAVLDNQGDMVCDAQVDLSITSPSGLVTKLSSTTGEVTVNLVTCLSKTYTLNPDYQATFHPTELGNYEVNMSTTTVDGTRSISSSFRVSSSVPFDVERVTITRIYPRLDYPVILRVHAFEDFIGTVEDVIPANFELIKPAGDQNPEYTVSSRGDTQVLSWNVVWQKGGDYVLSYQFNPPDKSPDFYTFGPLKIGNRFSEIKTWQLAIDATTTIILNYAHTILTSGTTWTVPADWTDANNTIEVIGGGGAGRTDTTGAAGAGGGGGGAYAKSVNISLTPGGTVDYQIGQGGIATSVNGTDTFFNRTAGTAGTCADTTSACAKGGTGATTATGTAGGTAASSFATGTGNVKNNGGTGGTGSTTSDSGGGGGGAGGPNGAGGTGGAGDNDNATDGVGGGGGGNGGGANGGSGITSDTIGAAGGNGNGGTGGGTGGTAADGANGTANTGGGGGGGSDNMDGGGGANGSDLVAGVNVGSGGGGGGTGDTATTTGMGGNGGLYGGGGGGGRYGGFGAPGVIIITYNGNTPTKNTWVVPADWNSADNTVTVIGGGGAGVSSAAGAGAGGGGGGGYSKSTNLSLTLGANIAYQVGNGGRKTTVGAGAGTAGTASFFNRTAGSADTCADTVSVCANPGSAGSTTTGGAGGSTTGADGATLLAGGAGGAGNSTGDTSGGGGGAGGTAIGQVGGAGNATTSGGGGGGGGAGGTSSSVGQAGQTGTGGTGGNGPAGTGSGAAGNAGHGGAGTSATGGGGGGGDDVFGGGVGGSGSSTTYGGGGGGGAGDNNTAVTSAAYGGHGGLHGGGGGGGLTNGFGAEGIIIITYTPAEITISGSANGNDGATVKWAKNGTVQASSATIGASAWTITAITPPPSSGDIITVWVDGATDANETTAVTKWTSGNITGMVLNTNVVSVGSNQDTSLSITNLENYDCTQNEDIMYQAASSHLKIEGDACAGSTTNTYTSEKLEILSGDTMTVATAETVTTYDLTITGTLTSSGNSTYNVSHDWAKTGTFTSSTSTVNLTGADSSTQTLSGSTSFNNLSVSTSSNAAGRTITHTAGTTQTVTGTWTITGFTGKVITLGSSAASAWTINPTATAVDYASISYSTNSGTSFCATHSTDGGNNTGWNLICTPTANSFQRKTWHDGTRYWRSSFDISNARLIFEYSTDGASWTENTSARITTSNSDYSLEADSTNIFIVYTSSNDIKGRAGSSYPGTGFSWGSEQVVLNGTSSTADYSYPVISRDSSNNVWVGSRYTGTGVYFIKTIKETGGINDLPEDSGDTVYSIGNTYNTNSNVYANLSSTGSSNMYITFTYDAAIQGCKWVNTASAWRNSSDISCSLYSGSYLFNITHETGDLSEYSTTSTDGGNLSVTVPAALNGSGYGLSAVINDNNTLSAYKVITKSTQIRYRFYVDPNSITMANGDNTQIHAIEQGGGSYSNIIYGGLGYSTGSGYYLSQWGNNDANTQVFSDSVDISDAPHYVEVQAIQATNATSNDGSYEWWVDGVSQGSLTGIDNFNIMGDQDWRAFMYAGNIDTGTRGTIYLDDYAGNTTGSEIGPLPNTDQIATGVTGLPNSFSSVSDSSGNIHLLYIDSSNHTVYRERTTSWQTPVTLDGNAGNSYPSISLNTSNNDLYTFWIRNDDIFYKKGISAYTSGDWDTNATSWQATGTNTHISSNYSASNKIFAQWYDGSSVAWDQLTITPTYATTNSFQRKTWFDGTRYWRGYLDTANNRIRFDYSTTGASWTENTSARITANTTDFSIESDSSNLFIVYTSANDIKGRSATTYPGTGFAWSAEQVVLNGTGATDDYNYPVISRDSSNYVWVGARYKGAGVYYLKNIKEAAGTNDLPEDSGDTVYALANTSNSNSNVYGSFVSLGSQDMYTTFTYGTAIQGCKWVNSASTWQDTAGNSCVGYTGTYLFNISHEVGDLTEYDTTSTDGGNLSVTAGSALNGSGYGLSALINDNNTIWGRKNVTKTANFRSRFYFDPNGITMANNDSYLISKLYQNGGAYASPYELKYRRNSSGVYMISFGGNDDAGSWSNYGESSVSDAPHYIEVNIVSATSSSSNDGSYEWFIDGVSQNLFTGIDNYNTLNDLDWIIALGAEGVDTGTRGTVYFDDFAGNTSGAAIGGIPSADQIGTGTTGLTTTLSSVADASGNVHLTYINSSGNSNYRERTTSWQTPVTLDSNAGNSYPTISYNTTTTDVYAFWIRSDDVFYKKGVSTYGSGNWDVSATSWQTAGTNTHVSSNYSGSDNIFAQWNDGTTINWDILSLGNVSPNSPTTLAQKTVADATISTGSWVSSTSIKFNVTATDTDNPDTLYLCIEKDVLGVSFSNAEDSCGTGVAYSGSGVTLTHTITSQTDASEYHWQARIKDSAGSYSAWVAYGANAESARDYGLDTTAPTGGTVYDGSGAGVDVSYSDSSLSALSANWGSINTDVSGLNKYEYSIGTTVGGTQIKTWTDNTTSTSVTTTGLTLSSSTLYYVNVRTTDNAGNVSSVISSNGQLVSPSISFTVSPLPVTFVNINAANSYSDTKTTTLTTSTNAYNGYVIRAFVSDYLRSTDGASTIPDFTAGSYATPATWAGAETGLGYTSSDTTIGGANKFATGTLYAPFNHTGPGDIVADHTNTVSGTPVANEVFTLTYKVKTPATQEAKRYSNTVILTATAQY